VIEIAELLDPVEADPPWPLLKQLGVDHIVSLLEGGEQRMRFLRGVSQLEAPGVIEQDSSGAGPCWSRPALERLKQRYEAAGFALDVIEDNPPMDKIRLGLPGSEEQFEWFCDQIRAMGELGIPVLCYNWVAVYDWARTAIDIPTRGNALVTGYSHAVMKQFPPAPEGETVTDVLLWETLETFLRRVIPVAEKAGVQLALHPDDPPMTPVFGIARIMRSVDAFQRVIDLVPSTCNGITMCQGNFSLMTEDLPGTIRHFGRQGKIFFVHFRDVRGTPEDFVETFHDDGQTDMYACMRAYADIGFDGVLRPDHVPTLYGETNDKPGYETLGRLFAVGYAKGLREAAYWPGTTALAGRLDDV
jgi:mannonate dehydratase